PRAEYAGSITVLADGVAGKRLNPPNDIACQSSGAVWFTDPVFGILGWWEGEPATPELPHGVYRIDPDTGALAMVLDDLQGSNGLAFSPGERTLYVVESRATPWSQIWAHDVDGPALRNKRLYVEADDGGAYDGIAVDERGNVWCGLGGTGAPGSDPAKLDGVRVYDAGGRPLAHIHLPERCANLCFGGAKPHRLFLAAGH